MVWRSGRSRVRQKKGAIETVYTAPPEGSVTVCLDQMGPVAVKSYPGKQLVYPEAGETKPAGRAKQEIDYGRREKAGYVFGALQPKTGEVFTCIGYLAHPLKKRRFWSYVYRFLRFFLERMSQVASTATSQRHLRALLEKCAAGMRRSPADPS